MQMTRIGLIGPTYQSQSQMADGEDLINWYPEAIESPLEKGVATYLPTPGLALFATLGAGPIRAMFAQDGRAFAVSAGEVYEYFFDGTSIVRGAVVNDSLPASISSNGSAGNQLFIVSGGYGYIYDLLANTVTLIADGDFPQGTAAMGAFFDGFFLVLIKNSRAFQFSALEDGTDWDPLDVGEKSITSDNVRALVVSPAQRLMFLLGSRTTEVWGDVGGDFPFAPVGGSLFNHGIGSAWCWATGDSGLYYVEESENGGRVAYRASGASGIERISTHAVEYRWKQYSTIADAVSWTYQEQGHKFWVIDFPTGNATWVFDEMTSLWHKRGRWNGLTFDVQRALWHSYIFDRHVVGSRYDGSVYTQSTQLFTDVGDTVRRERTTTTVENNGNMLTFGDLFVTMDNGIGLSSGQGSDPLVMFRSSNDGGMTFGNERLVSAGPLGQYRRRVRLRRNGRSRRRTWNLAVSDPVAWAIVEMYVHAKGGIS